MAYNSKGNRVCPRAMYGGGIRKLTVIAFYLYTGGVAVKPVPSVILQQGPSPNVLIVHQQLGPSEGHFLSETTLRQGYFCPWFEGLDHCGEEDMVVILQRWPWECGTAGHTDSTVRR